MKVLLLVLARGLRMMGALPGAGGAGRISRRGGGGGVAKDELEAVEIELEGAGTPDVRRFLGIQCGIRLVTPSIWLCIRWYVDGL